MFDGYDDWLDVWGVGVIRIGCFWIIGLLGWYVLVCVLWGCLLLVCDVLELLLL